MTHLKVHHDGYLTRRQKVRFDWSNTRCTGFRATPSPTHMLNVFHLMLPVSERWFIRTITEVSTQLVVEYLEQSPAARAAREPADTQLAGSEG